MFKRYSQYQGGICDPLVISWPAGIEAKGEVRQQYHHCNDIVPTILECCGVEMPEVVDGYKQIPLPGVSMRYSFDDADAPTQKETQYYEMLGTRGIWHKGWKAAAEHGPVPLNLGKFDQDRWQLFHTDEDRSEAHDLADQHPDKLEELKALWLEEAKKYDVLPLNDLGIFEFRALEYVIATPKSGQYTYYPGTAEIPEASAARTTNASYKILAEVEFTPESQGVIVAQGSRFGGYSLFVKDGKLHVRLQLPRHPARAAGSSRDAPSAGTHVVGIEFTQGARRRSPRAARAAQALRRRRGRRRRRCAPAPGLGTASAARASASATTAATPSARVQAEVRVHRREDRQGRLRRR